MLGLHILWLAAMGCHLLPRLIISKVPTGSTSRVTSGLEKRCPVSRDLTGYYRIYQEMLCPEKIELPCPFPHIKPLLKGQNRILFSRLPGNQIGDFSSHAYWSFRRPSAHSVDLVTAHYLHVQPLSVSLFCFPVLRALDTAMWTSLAGVNLMYSQGPASHYCVKNRLSVSECMHNAHAQDAERGIQEDNCSQE